MAKTDFLQKNRAPHNRETTVHVYQLTPAHFPEILFVTYMYCVWAFEVVESYFFYLQRPKQIWRHVYWFSTIIQKLCK